MTTERVNDLIARVMLKHPGESKAAQAAYFEDVHQELAPLARDLEKQRAELLAICEELQESAEYWSEYFVPLGIVERLDAAIASVKGKS